MTEMQLRLAAAYCRAEHPDLPPCEDDATVDALSAALLPIVEAEVTRRVAEALSKATFGQFFDLAMGFVGTEVDCDLIYEDDA